MVFARGRGRGSNGCKAMSRQSTPETSVRPNSPAPHGPRAGGAACAAVGCRRGPLSSGRSKTEANSSGRGPGLAGCGRPCGVCEQFRAASAVSQLKRVAWLRVMRWRVASRASVGNTGGAGGRRRPADARAAEWQRSAAGGEEERGRLWRQSSKTLGAQEVCGAAGRVAGAQARTAAAPAAPGTPSARCCTLAGVSSMI